MNAKQLIEQIIEKCGNNLDRKLVLTGFTSFCIDEEKDIWKEDCAVDFTTIVVDVNNPNTLILHLED